VNIILANARNNETTSYTYRSLIKNGTLEQKFSFSSSEFNSKFADSCLLIPGRTTKWTILFNTSFPFTRQLKMKYKLSMLQLLPFSVASDLSLNISSIMSSSSSKITTYIIPLLSSALQPTGQLLVAQLVVLDLALVDGQRLAVVNHTIISSPSDNTTLALVLTFPPISKSLEYDPVLGLGTLVTGSHQGGSSNNLAIIVGCSIGGSVAVLVVCLVVFLSGYWARRATLSGISVVNV